MGERTASRAAQTSTKTQVIQGKLNEGTLDGKI